METDTNTNDMLDFGGQNTDDSNDRPAAVPGSQSMPKSAQTTTPPNTGSRPFVDVDLLKTNFYDEFEAAPQVALTKLFDLLCDGATCEARCITLEEAANNPAPLEWLECGLLDHPIHFVRELSWLADGTLKKAVESGISSPLALAQLASHPDTLRLARQVYVDGETVIDDMIKLHQVEAWHWLRVEISNGNLRKYLGDQVIGKHVAVWKKEQPYAEIEIGDIPECLRYAIRERFMVSNQLIAVAFVDAD